jgi:hypothetical protein
VVKAWGLWDLPTDPYTQSLGGLFEYYSGIPEERLYLSQGIFGSSYDVRIRPRGTYLRYGAWWTLGAKFEQTVDLRKGRLIGSVEVTNIFNNQAPDVIDFGAVDTQNRLITVSRQNPLELLLGMRYEY